MKKERIEKYLYNKCIVILKNRFKYEGKLLSIYDDSFIIKDRSGDIEIDMNSVALISEVQE